MSSIAHSFSEQTTRQTVTSVVYTSVLTHAAVNFVAGGKYLLMVTALCDGPNSTDHIKMRTTHGGVAFADSEYTLEPANLNKRYNYAWFKVWTAVGGESIDFEIACSVGLTVGADLIFITAIRLDVDLIENTDWFYAEDGVDVALSTTPVDGASVSFTSVISSHWAVLTTAQLKVTSLTVNYATSINSSGTYNEVVPKGSREGEDNTNILLCTLGRVFTDLGAAVQTYKEQSFNEVANSGQRLHSAIFAINLTKFRNIAFSWDDDEEVLSGLDWDNLFGGVTYLPEISTDIWVLASGVYDVASVGNEVVHRLQVDSVDQPSNQTLNRYLEEESADAIDELAIWRQTLETGLGTTNHIIEWAGDGGSSQVNGPTVKNRSLFVISMELSRDLPTIAKIPYQTNEYTTFEISPPYESCGTLDFDEPNIGSLVTVETPAVLVLSKQSPSGVAFSRQTPAGLALNRQNPASILLSKQSPVKTNCND